MKKKIVHGGLALATRQLISLPLNILAILYVSRILNTTDFAVQAILIPATAFAFLFSDLGLSKSLVQSKHHAHSSLILKIQVLKHAGALTCLLILSCISILLINTNFLPRYFFFILPFAALLGLLQSQRNFFSVPLQRDIQWPLLAKIEMTEVVLYNFTLILTAYLSKSAYCFPLALTVRYTGGIFLLYFVNKYVIKHVYNQTGSNTIQDLLKFGFPLQASEIFGILNGLVNPVLVGGTLGVHAVGIVNWCTTIISIPRAPLQPLPGFLFSILSSRSRMEINDNRLVSSTAFITTVILSMISLFIAASLDWLIYNVFSEKWAEAKPVALILLLSNVFIMPTILIVAQLSAKGLSITWLKANVLGTSLLWLATYLGIMLFSLTGFTVAWVAASFFPLLYLSIKARNRIDLKIHWFDSLYIILITVVSYLLAEGFISGTSFSLFIEMLIKTFLSSFAFIILLCPILYLRKEILIAGYKAFLK